MFNKKEWTRKYYIKNREKLLEENRRWVKTKEGKACKSKYQKEWRKKNPERAKEMDRKKRIRRRTNSALYARERYLKIKDNPDFKNKRNERTLVYYYKNKEKASARGQVSKALRSNKIKKPDLCQLCYEKRKLHAHHEDYKKPLEVLWICEHCHRIIENYKLLIIATALRQSLLGGKEER